MEPSVTAHRPRPGSPNRWPPPGCLNCGPVELQPVFDGEITNFYCGQCGRCWHFELGFVVRVHPEACPGCQLGFVCQEGRSAQTGT